MPEEESLAGRLLARNARWGAFAVGAADCRDRLGTALAAPGDPMAFARAAVAVLRLNVIAEELADPDCTELAGRHLRECVRAASALPVAFHTWEVIRTAADDVRDAEDRVEPLTLRHRATRADNAGRPDVGWDLRARALRLAPKGSYLEAVLLIELGRMAEAARVLDELSLPDAAVMAELNVQAERPDVARQILARAPALPPESPWADLGRRARIALGLGDVAAADELAGRAVAAFERIPATSDYYRALAGDHATVAGLYHVAARARWELGDVAGAFQLADRIRAAGVRPGRNRLAREAEARLGATHERVAVATLRGAAPWAAEVVAEVVAAEEAVSRVPPRPPVPVGMDDVRRSLAADAALLYYQSFDQDLIVWAVRRDGVTTRRLNRGRRDLARAVRELHAACADLSGDGARVPRLAARLATDLIDPVAASLEGAGRLFVAPPGNLMLLPFAVLPLNGIALGEQFVLSVLPAAALLAGPEAGGGVDTNRGALLAGSEAGGGVDMNRGALLIGDPDYAGLPRLPGTGVEVRAIAARLPSALVLTGPAATGEAFGRHATGRSVVHLATHGMFDELRPHLTELALSGRDRITLPDLAALDLNPDLLVLSACHTGRGRATLGGEVLGLARTMLASGVRHLIVSLWPVDDVSACLVMATMYRRLSRGHGVAEALACASRSVRAMDGKQRATAYARLAGVSGTGRARDLTATGSSVSGENPAAHWAPFIHIGI